ncbi:MAG: HAD-IC family P-type ATPase, partial [SAR202 cluster bacterium]|nr:HAD-IC family P-type ATPase [SAR202 cluster bacterium]
MNPHPESPTQATTQPVWHADPVENVAKKLDTALNDGVTKAQAEPRLAEFGPNTLQTIQQVRWHTVLARQYINALILILFLAAGISLAVGEATDAITILIIILLNSILGFLQEWRAEHAIKALQEMLSASCTVVRDGQEQTIDAEQLVPGDIVLLDMGARVPADLRLAESLNLKVDESSLTGESVSVRKDIPPVPPEYSINERASMAWMGTTVMNGRARGVVVATGMNTEFGRIATLTQTVGDETTPLQRKLGVLGRQLGALSIAISILIVVLGWSLGKPLSDMFFTGVSLAVAVVPEGLPVVVTITLALGIRAMVRRKALLRRLQAAETLGAASVICTDKTGTLTENEMTVQRILLPGGEFSVTGVGYEPEGDFAMDGQIVDPARHPDLMALLETSLRCNNADISYDGSEWSHTGEPTEAALVVAAHKAGLRSEETLNAVSEFSFNSSRKRMTVMEQNSDGLMAHVKGAPEVILERCSRILDHDQETVMTAANREIAVEAYLNLARQGLRTLAIARRRLPADVPLDEENVEQEL